METVIFWCCVLLSLAWTIGWFMSPNYMIIPVLMMWGVVFYFYRAPDVSKFHMLWAMPAAIAASLVVTTPYLRWRNAAIRKKHGLGEH